MKNRKLLRATRPDVYISEDLTQMRSRLLYVARTIKRERKIQDCWSYDGRIVVVVGLFNTIMCFVHTY